MGTQTIGGIVKDAAGEAWEGALVEIQLDGGSGQIVGPAATGITGSDGAFSVNLFNGSETEKRCLVRLPDGSLFAFSLDPSDDTVNVGMLQASGVNRQEILKKTPVDVSALDAKIDTDLGNIEDAEEVRAGAKVIVRQPAVSRVVELKWNGALADPTTVVVLGVSGVGSYDEGSDFLNDDNGSLLSWLESNFSAVEVFEEGTLFRITSETPGAEANNLGCSSSDPLLVFTNTVIGAKEATEKTTVDEVRGWKVFNGKLATAAPSDRGTFYRLQNGANSLTLPPAAECIPGQTVYYMQALNAIGIIYADEGDEIEGQSFDPPNFSHASSSVFNIPRYAVAEIRCVSSSRWVCRGTYTIP